MPRSHYYVIFGYQLCLTHDLPPHTHTHTHTHTHHTHTPTHTHTPHRPHRHHCPPLSPWKAGGQVDSKWQWQVSPWGAYEAHDVNVSLMPDVNVTVKQRKLLNRTKVGTYGGNDTCVDFAGSTVIVDGSNIVCVHPSLTLPTVPGSLPRVFTSQRRCLFCKYLSRL